MTIINITNIERTYKNWGNHCEQALAYTLTGEMRKHDRIAYNVDSDIPEYHMSVKSSAFTLMSGRLCNGYTTKEEIIEWYFRNTASECVTYVTKEMIGYKMNMAEFAEFLSLFTYINRDSTRNGGLHKVKCRNETKAMRMWLASHAA